MLLATFLFGLIFFAGFFIIKRREEAHKQQMLQAESEILQLRNDKLAAELNAKNSKLMSSAAQMAHKNEILNKVKEALRDSEEEKTSKIPQLIRMLDSELQSEDYWEEFNVYFNQVDRSFIGDLIKHHPNLTQNDIRLCTLMRINLSTKEIASLLNVSTRAVEQSRYRLKKRLDLGNEEDLLKYISGF
jgi:DNA-binding CsgD family transcriptional regulator